MREVTNRKGIFAFEQPYFWQQNRKIREERMERYGVRTKKRKDTDLVRQKSSKHIDCATDVQILN